MGTGSPPAPEPDYLYLVMPDGGGGLTATDVSLPSGILAGELTRSHGIAFGDYDEDGDVDTLVNPGGTLTFQSLEPGCLFRSAGNARGWMAVGLRGVLSNRKAVGARAVVISASGREVHRQLIAGKGFGNTDSPVLHFGLADEETVNRAIVTWPSGLRQMLLSPSTVARHDVVETGMRLVGDPAIGTTITFELCGPAGHVAELLVGTATIAHDMSAFGGVLYVAPPWLGPLPQFLDGGGRLDIPYEIPSMPLLQGLSVYLQAWTHAPGATSGGTLRNLVELTFV